MSKLVGSSAIGQPHQRPHQRDLFDLLLQEPLHELLAEEVTFVAGHRRQLADLFTDRTLLIERQRVARFVELITHRAHSRDLDIHVAVE
jgi:hypothetical protein